MLKAGDEVKIYQRWKKSEGRKDIIKKGKIKKVYRRFYLIDCGEYLECEMVGDVICDGIKS